MSFPVDRAFVVGAALLAACLMTGCPGDAAGEPDGGTGDDNCSADSEPCQDDRTCPGGFCDIADGADTGCCVRTVCFGDADCPEGKICDERRGICVPENLCNPGDDTGCPVGEKCTYEGGEPLCNAQQEDVASCAVAAGGRQINDGSGELASAVTTDGSPIKLEATAYDATGALVPHAEATWTGTGVAADGTLTGTCAGPAPCAVTATATFGGTSCDGVVNVYPDVAVGSFRIVALDLFNGQPLPDGTPCAANLGAGPVADVTVDGACTFVGTATSISIFPANHQWHTIMDPSSDTVVFTGRLQDTTQVAGVKGTFDFESVSTQGDIKLGLSGTAIGSAITDLDFSTIIGEIADYQVELEGVTDPGGQLVPLPSGLVIELGTEKIKGEYVTFGSAGPNIAWAIGGKVRLSEVGPIISRVTGSDDINVGGILGAVLPFFSRFDHAVITDLGELELSPRPEAPGEDQPVPFADWDFPTKVLTPDTLLSQSANYNMPDLPCTPGGGTSPACTLPANLPAGSSPWTTGAVLLSGVIVPGYGLIPLGLTAGLDDFDSDDGDDFDGKLSYDETATGAPDDGQAIVDYAPPHDGLEGFPFITVAIALDVNNIATDNAGFGASIVTHVTDAYGTGQNTFPQGAFLESQGGVFSSAAGTFDLTPVGTADFYRVNFDNGGDDEWNVWFSDPTTAIDVAELAPAGVAVTPRVQHADVQAFNLGTGYAAGPTPTDLDDLFGFNGTNFDNLLLYLGSWSSEACKADFQTLAGPVVIGHCSDIDAPVVAEEP